MDKFLLASNPLRPESTGAFLIHMLDPVTIIECEEKALDPPAGKTYKQYELKENKWTLTIYFTSGTLDNSDHLLDRAWRWYRSYLEKK